MWSVRALFPNKFSIYLEVSANIRIFREFNRFKINFIIVPNTSGRALHFPSLYI